MTNLPKRPLSRKAIKQFFDKVGEASWDYYFDIEKSNGLAQCRVEENGRLARYDPEKIKEWLLSEGHYRLYDFDSPEIDRFLHLPIRRHVMAG